MKRYSFTLVMSVVTVVSASGSLSAYTPVTWAPGLVPGIGPGVITPDLVFGKEYSHDLDEDSLGLLSPEQVIAWDGIGGIMDGLNYVSSRGPNDPRLQQVDALAHSRDALYHRLFNATTLTSPDQAHLVFSIDDSVWSYAGGAGGLLQFPVPGAFVPPTGPVALSNGNVIGGAGDISIEHAGAFAPPETQGVWTTAAFINANSPPRDIDGLELWGPEPPAFLGDADKYSLDIDVIGGAGISVWSYDSGTHTSVPYIPHATIAGAVESLLGPVPASAMALAGPLADAIFGREAINLDALMVFDTVGSTDSFDANSDVAGGPGAPPHDSIIFSIRQIVDPQDPTGYYATGSELFVLDASGYVDFLRHGGHVWDKAYALANLQIMNPDGHLAIIDINAIEAIGEVVVPEPTTALLLAMCLASATLVRFRV